MSRSDAVGDGRDVVTIEVEVDVGLGTIHQSEHGLQVGKVSADYAPERGPVPRVEGVARVAAYGNVAGVGTQVKVDCCGHEVAARRNPDAELFRRSAVAQEVFVAGFS